MLVLEVVGEDEAKGGLEDVFGIGVAGGGARERTCADERREHWISRLDLGMKWRELRLGEVADSRALCDLEVCMHK